MHIKDFESGDWLRFNDSCYIKYRKMNVCEHNLNGKPQTKKIIKTEAPAGTTEKTGEKETEKEKDDVMTVPAPKDNKKTEAEITKQKIIDTVAQLAAKLATRNENDQVMQVQHRC